MTEIEYPAKTCQKCGAKCDRLVLVCTSCSEVLPDLEFVAENPSSEVVSKRISDELPIRKVFLFLVSFAIVVWLASRH